MRDGNAFDCFCETAEVTEESCSHLPESCLPLLQAPHTRDSRAALNAQFAMLEASSLHLHVESDSTAFPVRELRRVERAQLRSGLEERFLARRRCRARRCASRVAKTRGWA